MAIKNELTRAAAGVVFDRVIAYADKDPEKAFQNILEFAEKYFADRLFPAENLKKMKEAAGNPENAYVKFGKNILKDVNRKQLKHLLLTAGIDAGLYGTRTVRANREKYGCNIPWLLLFDPTSACNMHCKGCWAAEYGNSLNLTPAEMQSIVDQGKALGTHVYMMTGGEPLIKKNEILTLCRNNPDCVFLAYTNATLIDDEFCKQVVDVGNLTFALSVEGSCESTDARRGEGCYDKVMNAMDILKRNGCFFGISVCYTHDNVPYVTSDEFLNSMVEKGVKFAFYFNYMPVGHDADKALIPTPADRKYMYYWIKKTRNGDTGKPMFVFDFQNDGEYVGGCIAGGRNYFHINSAGDMEPCVFIHYSDANIRTHTLLEGLKNPLFTAYYKGQPFNDNHLRPCPMLENPDKLRKMIKETDAKSTDFLVKEDVDTLCGRCDEFALAWQPVADELWAATKHPLTHTQYYRDGGKAKMQ